MSKPDSNPASIGDFSVPDGRSVGGLESSISGMSTSNAGTSRLGGSEFGIPSTPGRRANMTRNMRVFSAPRSTPSFADPPRMEGSEQSEAGVNYGRSITSEVGGGGLGQDGSSSSGMNGAALQEEFLWGTNVSVSVLESQIKEFFENFRKNVSDENPTYMTIMQEIAATQNGPAFLNLDCDHLRSYNMNLYRTLVDYVESSIQLFDIVASDKYCEWAGVGNSSAHLQVRPYNLTDEVAMRDLDPSDINKLISIRGMVIRVSSVVPDLNTAFFECSICRNTEEVQSSRGRIDEPLRCQHCQKEFTMSMIHNRCKFADKQHIKLQEAPESIPDGQTPKTVLLVCLDEFTDFVQPGDRVVVTGMYQASSIRPNKNQRTIKSVFKTHVEVFHFMKFDKARISRDKVDGEDEFVPDDIEDVHSYAAQTRQENQKLIELSQKPDIYERLTRAVAPGIWEHEDIKKGILCQLFGGVSKNLKSIGLGRSRGDINILLCGDPGTSKSQFLTHVNKIAPRGIYTSGKGSSSVGLTAYVTKDPVSKEIVLESGALVLSDGGICCIDEFDKMNESTRSVLHEAMEQQTISIAKAGIICTLNARTSILAAANPINSSWNPKIPIVDNINLPPTLLSRFDLIYLVLDQPDPVHDRQLARHITAMYAIDDEEAENRDDGVISVEQLAAYISYARENFNPTITDSAATDLINAYMDLRHFGGDRKTITATPRQLESLIRIAEARAKMRFSNDITPDDVAEALRLVKTALCQSVTDPTTGLVDMSIITTGQSESSRVRQQGLVDELKDFLRDSAASGGGGGSASYNLLRLKQVLFEFNNAQNKDIQLYQLKEACHALQSDKFLIYEPRQETIRVVD